MKRIKTFAAAAICIFGATLSTGFAAVEKDNSCANPQRLKAAQLAMEAYRERIQGIPGVIRLGVDSCSEVESAAVTVETGFICGVYIWFGDDEARSVFFESSKIWNATVPVETEEKVINVPLCSRVPIRPVAETAPSQ